MSPPETGARCLKRPWRVESSVRPNRTDAEDREGGGGELPTGEGEPGGAEREAGA